MGEMPKPVELTNAFEMMSTPVTQRMWAEIMGENPAHFFDREDSLELRINGKPIKMQPDHPIENITWLSAAIFANKLSISRGLKPVYDLSEVQVAPWMKAEKGEIYHSAGDLKLDAPNGNIYEAEGYRLPTEAEFEYVLMAAGKNTGTYFFGEDHSQLKNYAWYGENANSETKGVARLLPLIINGQRFYDLLGNVDEWVHDWHNEWHIRQGINPAGISMGTRKVIRGGGFITAYPSSRSRSDYDYTKRSQAIGFRLVRTLK